MTDTQLTAGRDGDRMIAEKLGWRVIEVEGLWFLVQPAELRENYIRWSMADPSAFKRAGKSNAEAAWKFDRDVIQHYTTSVDAALTLPIPEGAFWVIHIGVVHNTVRATLYRRGYDLLASRYSDMGDGMAALAVCRAWLAWQEAK